MPSKGYSPEGRIRESELLEFLEEPEQEIIGREDEIISLQIVLRKKRMRNIVLVGEAGVGKTELVKEVARREKENGYAFIEFFMTNLVANTKYRGEFSKKALNAIYLLRRYGEETKKKVICFIDEAHMMVKNGGTGEDASDCLGNMLKPYLSSGKITIWGATTPKEYKETFLLDPALARRMGTLYIGELSKEAVMKILTNFAKKKVSNRMLEVIYGVSTSIPNSHQPDIGIELLDRVMATSKFTGEAITDELVKKIGDSMKISFKSQCDLAR